MTSPVLATPPASPADAAAFLAATAPRGGALVLARAGFRVQEMLGGIEYRIRAGLAVETAAGRIEQEPDPLTTPCGC
ncbi:hypothetical protein [Pseudonocardia sp. T1-2H]|uniref:hypothetical protein n=1 Tax=Pseudonocardia sp. T1-2H TaxID=3128899 RepID=UPI003100DAD0